MDGDHGSGAALRRGERRLHIAPRGREQRAGGQEAGLETHSWPAGLAPFPEVHRAALRRRLLAAALHAVSDGAAGEAVDLAFLLSQSLAAMEQEEQVKRKEEAKKALRAWKQRRKRVKDEFVALIDFPTLSPHDERKLRELVSTMEAMDASRPGSSSASSSDRKKKKKKGRKGGGRR